MASSPSSPGCDSDQDSTGDKKTFDVEAIHLDEDGLTRASTKDSMVSTKDSSGRAAQFEDLGTALKQKSACSPYDPVPTFTPSTTSIDVPALTTHPDYQLPPQQAYKQSPSRKRKFRVTTMANPPLKLRLSWTDARPLGLDGTVDSPSPWDALAGEDSRSDDNEPVPDRRVSVPSSQQAGLSAHAPSAPPTVIEARFPVLREGDEIYVVTTRPFIPDPNGVLADIYICLCEAGLAPFGKNNKFDFMFVKPAWQPLPFQSERWQRLCGVRKIRMGD